jgi:hypothetical protein
MERTHVLTLLPQECSKNQRLWALERKSREPAFLDPALLGPNVGSNKTRSADALRSEVLSAHTQECRESF